MTSINLLKAIHSDTRICLVTKNKYRKILYHSGINPALLNRINCVIVLKENDIDIDNTVDITRENV